MAPAGSKVKVRKSRVPSLNPRRLPRNHCSNVTCGGFKDNSGKWCKWRVPPLFIEPDKTHAPAQ